MNEERRYKTKKVEFIERQAISVHDIFRDTLPRWRWQKVIIEGCFAYIKQVYKIDTVFTV